MKEKERGEKPGTESKRWRKKKQRWKTGGGNSYIYDSGFCLNFSLTLQVTVSQNSIHSEWKGRESNPRPPSHLSVFPSRPNQKWRKLTVFLNKTLLTICLCSEQTGHRGRCRARDPEQVDEKILSFKKTAFKLQWQNLFFIFKSVDWDENQGQRFKLRLNLEEIYQKRTDGTTIDCVDVQWFSVIVNILLK